MIAVGPGPDGWRAMNTDGGVLEIRFVYEGRYCTIRFEGADLTTLQRHTTVAIAQRDEQRRRNAG